LSISVRAKINKQYITYHVVDEYENFYQFKPKRSRKPLTNSQIRSLLWSIEVEGYGQIFTHHWDSMLENKDPAAFEDDFYTLNSPFYPGLQDWLEDWFWEWKATK